MTFVQGLSLRLPARPTAANRPFWIAVTVVLSPEVFEEFCDVDVRVAERAFECVTINFIVKGEHDPSSVRMLHFDVAAFAMNLNEAEPLQRSQHLPGGEQR